MTLPKITYEELMAEIDKYRLPINRDMLGDMPEEEKKALWIARTGKYPVSFRKLSELWLRCFEKNLSKSSLRERFEALKKANYNPS